jgi:hypothetical protein
MADTTISSLNTVNTLSANNFIPISDGTNTTKLGTDSLFGFRNRIINGDMRIWQRGTQFNDSNVYTADRWFVNRASGNAGITVNKQGTYNSTLRITRNQGNTSTTHFDFRQVIETLNCIDLAAKEVTFSFNAAKESNFTPSACYIEILYSTVADAPNITGPWTSLGFRQFNPTTSFQRFNETFTIPSNALTIMARIISGSYIGTAPANDAIEITQLQLEEGPTATPFERRLIGTELALCQRYYYQTSPSDYQIYLADYTSGTIMWHSFPQYMRIVPNVTALPTSSLYIYPVNYGATIHYSGVKQYFFYGLKASAEL